MAGLFFYCFKWADEWLWLVWLPRIVDFITIEIKTFHNQRMMFDFPLL